MKKKKYIPSILYGCDLETDNNGVDKAWIVQASFFHSKGVEHFKNEQEIENFFDTLLNTQNSVMYFHNLKYDLSFLLNILNRFELRGYELVIVSKMNNPIFVSIQNGDFSINIRDSSKKLHGTVKALGKLFKLDKLDSGTDFAPGWSSSVDFSDPSTWQYVDRDAEIVYTAMNDLHSKGYVNVTFSSDAYNKAKVMLYPNLQYTKANWNKHYPIIGIDVDKEIRPGYVGGLNISRHLGKTEGDITHIDAVSMYPSVMYLDELPFGLPIESAIPIDEQHESTLWIAKLKVKLKLREGRIPWFTFRSAYDYTVEGLDMDEPIVELKEYHEMILTSVDYDNLCRWYYVDRDAEYEEKVYIFKSDVIGRHSDYIDYFFNLKNTSARGSIEREHAKLMLNSLYGKFGANPAGNDTVLVIENGIVRMKELPSVNDTLQTYLPLAMFITAHARKRLLKMMFDVGVDNVIHCDTDSVIFKGNVDGLNLQIGSNLGDWAEEKKPKIIYEGGFKRYVEIYDDIKSTKDIKVTCAGVPQRFDNNDVPIGMWVEILDNPSIICSNSTLGNQNYKIKSKWLRDMYTKNNLDPDNVNTLKLLPKRVDGGIILEPSTFKLKNSGNKTFGGGKW